MIQSAAGEDKTEAASLVPSTAATIVAGGSSELGSDRDERFVKNTLFL